MTFSGRLPADLTPNRLTRALSAVQRAGRPLLDLTVSNPTRVDLQYPSDLLAPLGDPRGLIYAPFALGLPVARQAIAADFERRGLRVSADQLAVTSSTSEAYSLLFKVLCDPGDVVLVPRPSYPLFDHLTRLDAVVAVPYDLEYHGAWTINLAQIETLLTARSRLVLVVNPNNPTGQFTSRHELQQLAALCAARDVAIISDDVFADYEWRPGAQREAGHLVEADDVLGFTLGGLSKSIGLPQAKLAWMAMSGPTALVREASARLELACDTYLSVSTPVQASAGDLLVRGAVVRQQILDRVVGNRRTVERLVHDAPACTLLSGDGGWYAVLRVPSLMSEEDLVLTLLADEGVLVHPGYFFDFSTESFLILSLLPAAPVVAEGVTRILSRFSAGGARP